MLEQQACNLVSPAERQKILCLSSRPEIDIVEYVSCLLLGFRNNRHDIPQRQFLASWRDRYGWVKTD